MTTIPQLSARTFGNEGALPRVPLPELADTCDRFLQWCAPLLTRDELAATERAVARFVAPDSAAWTLHAALAEFNADEQVDSWLDAFWPYRYLGRRDRIALNANFFFLFNDTGAGQVERAAALIAGTVDYKLLIDREQLAPALQRGRPLAMDQNKYLFSATRIPGTEIDSARTPYSVEWPGPSHERHVIVFCRGSMFRLDVIGSGGAPHTLAELADGVRAVLAAARPPAAPGTSVGHLTTKARAEWAASRTALRELDPANAEALDTVERALFCVCLEDSAPVDVQAASDALLHGNSANRWFDKSVSFIVFADGRAGLNDEHCCLDGTTIVSLIDALQEGDPLEQSRRSGARAQGTPAITPIDFVLDAARRADIIAAGADFAAYAAATASATISFDDFGTEAIKAVGMSPDAFAQLAYQLAHYRAKGLVGATYESIAMRQYRHGRTEAMRVVTPEIVAFVAAMTDAAAPSPARVAAARAAAAAHVARAKECQAGQVPEQHLWELQLIQKRRGVELAATEPLELYDSPGWRIMRDDYLSTSSVPSVNVQYWGFGSTSAQCIGVAYALLPQRIRIYLSTPRSVGEWLPVFAANLTAAFIDLEGLLRPE